MARLSKTRGKQTNNPSLKQTNNPAFEYIAARLLMEILEKKRKFRKFASSPIGTALTLPRGGVTKLD